LTPGLRTAFRSGDVAWLTILQAPKMDAGASLSGSPRQSVPRRQYLPLIAVRLTFACAFAVFGSVTVRTPFWNEASTLSSSI
jgi:hypothetical protein